MHFTGFVIQGVSGQMTSGELGACVVDLSVIANLMKAQLCKTLGAIVCIISRLAIVYYSAIDIRGYVVCNIYASVDAYIRIYV